MAGLQTSYHYVKPGTMWSRAPPHTACLGAPLCLCNSGIVTAHALRERAKEDLTDETKATP